MKNKNQQKNSQNTSKEKAILLVSDDIFMKTLIAQINSIIKNIPEAKIYLVHSLSEANLEHINEYLYKWEKFDKTLWKHLPESRGHVTKTDLGKFQVDFIEEEILFYMDTDAIINKRFEWENTETMTCDIRTLQMDDKERYYEEKEAMRRFILQKGGLTEKEGPYRLFSDGAFFVNKKWMINTLRPKIVEVSKEYDGIPQRWYAMEYYHVAICLLNQPVKLWKVKQALPALFKEESLSEYDIIHFVSKDKPWLFEKGKYPYPGGDLWWGYYENGLI